MKMWIAKSRFGTVSLHSCKPIYEKEYGAWNKGFVGYLSCGAFPEVTFENSPMEVELVIKR